MKQNLTYIISNINKALAFEWITTHLNKESFNIHFILLNSEDSKLESFLNTLHIPVSKIQYAGKKDIPKAIIQTIAILRKTRTTVLHAHLFDACIVGLTAAWLCRVPKRIYTRHHSDFHHVYYPKAVKYDRYISFMATDIVAISGIVKNILLKKEGVPAKKIHLIHHGFLLEDFINVSEKNIQRVKEKYNPGNQRPVIGLISRYIKLKGVQYVIPAFQKLLIKYPDSLLILANATGDFKTEITQLLSHLPDNSYVELPFEDDIFALYKLFDIFVHVPIDREIEAFGQTYIESLAAGIPSIFTLSGVANEFIVDNQNALVVPFMNSEAIYNAITRLLSDPALCGKLVQDGKKSVFSTFNLNTMILALEKLYRK